jgi:hypothetical protein
MLLTNIERKREYEEAEMKMIHGERDLMVLAHFTTELILTINLI